MPESVLRSWHALFPSGALLREWLFEQIEFQIGLSADQSQWKNDDFDRAHRWAVFQSMESPIFLRSSKHLQNLMFANLSDKASRIAQRGCSVCAGLASEAEQFPRENFTVRIEPQSRQSMTDASWSAFQSMVREWFEGRGATIKRAPGLCLSMTFMLSTERPDKDLDNMAKAMCDAFSRAIGFDDRIIHHLDLVKLRGKFTEEYIKLRVQPSHISSNVDVIVTEAKHVWGVGERLRLSDHKSLTPK